MMRAAFSDVTAETREAFLNLVRNVPVTFYEVYSGTPSEELEQLFEEALPDELLLRFDMQTHSKEARARFCEVGDFERNAYHLPADAVEKPLPYFGAFIPPFGHFDIAWTGDEIRKLIARTRKEKMLAKQVAEYAAKRETA